MCCFCRQQSTVVNMFYRPGLLQKIKNGLAVQCIANGENVSG